MEDSNLGVRADDGAPDNDRRDARSEARTNLFIMATIYSPAGSAPVKVRDLSSHGALVEGPILADPGTKVRLSRGQLSIIGRVVWRKDARAGLHFDASLSVEEWFPRRRSSPPQQQVDEIVQSVKASQLMVGSIAPSYDRLEKPELTASDLQSLKFALESLADDLADDPYVLRAYAAKLQALDLAAQVIERVAAERCNDSTAS